MGGYTDHDVTVLSGMYWPAPGRSQGHGRMLWKVDSNVTLTCLDLADCYKATVTTEMRRR